MHTETEKNATPEFKLPVEARKYFRGLRYDARCSSCNKTIHAEETETMGCAYGIKVGGKWDFICSGCQRKALREQVRALFDWTTKEYVPCVAGRTSMDSYARYSFEAVRLLPAYAGLTDNEISRLVQTLGGMQGWSSADATFVGRHADGRIIIESRQPSGD